ncbi:MAG: VOC family protein [Pseudomonadota bacterium]
MIAAVVPSFFTTDIARTLAGYEAEIGFQPQFIYGDPPFYAGAIRDGLSIFFRHVDTVPPWPEKKYSAELIDAYLTVTGVEDLHEELRGRGALIHRGLARMPWGFTEFVIRDVDGRLLCFGEADDTT